MLKDILGKIYNKIYYIWNYKKYEKFPFLSREEIKKIQLEKLKKILYIAVTTVPFYKRLNIKINWDNFTLDELKKFPIIDKEIIIHNFEDFISSKCKFFGKLSSTSGSTGNPFKFYIPYNSEAIETFIMHRAWRMGKDYKYTPGDPVVVLRSYSPKENEPIYKIDKRKNYWYLSPFHINEKNLDIYLDIIYKSKAKILRGYPSSIYIFTLLLMKKNIKIPQIKLIVTSSETLLPHYRETIENYWGIPVLDWYGQNERTVIVSQCWAGNYHNHDDYGILELNENNEIIATSLNNYVMPFIRYNTKDIAIPLDSPVKTCKCGMNLSVPFKAIQGRTDDLLIKDDGTYVPTVNIYTMMYKIKGIKNFQIIQKKDKSLLVKLVADNNFNANAENILKKELKDRLGNLKIDIKLVDEIERNKKTGKIRTIIRER